MAGYINKQRRARVAAGLGGLVLAMLVGGCDDKIERKVGKLSSQAVEREYKVVDDPLLSEWVNTVGHTLVGNSMRQHVPYSFKVLDTELVNAFAAPYGYVYVTTGLLDFADHEDEVWGVMGHEVGHVVHRHSISSMKRGFLYQIGLAILGGSSGALSDVAGVGLGLLSLRHSRENEYDADDMGRRLSYAAAYDPHGNVSFFEKLQAKHEKSRPSSLEVMFRTHPPSSRRIARQRAMPELSANNGDALMRIGRGYARRYQFRRAEESVAKAVALKPQDPGGLVTLADIQMERGRYAQAADNYETAAAIRPSRYASAGVRLALAGAPGLPAPASGGERIAAVQMMGDARSAADRAGIVVNEARLRASKIGTALAPAASGTHSIIDSLFGAADLQPNLSNTAKGVVTYANGAVNRAIEPVYSVERQRESLLRSAQQMQSTIAQVMLRLQVAQTGDIAQGEVETLGRTLREARRGLEDIRAALTELERAQPAVAAAEKSAMEATRFLERIMAADPNRGIDTSVLWATQQAAQLTEARGLAALAATRKSKKLADRAAVRSLVARINVSAIGAPSYTRENLDGLVAHYTLAKPQTVSQLRTEGIGYGDAALALAASRSVPAKPQELARLGAGVRSMVDQVNAAGARTDGALLLLKYLANAMEYEMGKDDSASPAG